ncbi:MAG TPA: DNA-processing protein DprA [Luteolibacter sp.]|nr:DNA-processing protein DprA [Luteolibacter sp.]
MSSLEALVALNLLPGIGPIRANRLIEAFGSADQVLASSAEQLQQVSGIGGETAASIQAWRKHIDPVAEIRCAEALGYSLLTREDPLYPMALREAYDAPLLLYVWGRLELRDAHALGIVGSRRCSFYGLNTTRRFAAQIAASGMTIVSGLARGIDTAAHEAALEGGGRTIAVLGSGLAKLYPPENLALAQRIADGRGAVVSEFPLHTPPDKHTFPTRNRIVAAWSCALLVVECPVRSGAMITANLANEYGRPVLAVPGPIDRPGSSGCHQLIRDGATLVWEPLQILEELGFQGALPQAPSADPTPLLPPDEAAIWAALDSPESSVDQLVERCHLPPSTVSSSLLKLEMRGLVKVVAGSRFARRL